MLLYPLYYPLYLTASAVRERNRGARTPARAALQRLADPYAGREEQEHAADGGGPAPGSATDCPRERPGSVSAGARDPAPSWAVKWRRRWGRGRGRGLLTRSAADLRVQICHKSATKRFIRIRRASLMTEKRPEYQQSPPTSPTRRGGFVADLDTPSTLRPDRSPDPRIRRRSGRPDEVVAARTRLEVILHQAAILARVGALLTANRHLVSAAGQGEGLLAEGRRREKGRLDPPG